MINNPDNINTDIDKPGLLDKTKNWFAQEEKKHETKEWANDKHGKAVVEKVKSSTMGTGLSFITIVGISCFYSGYTNAVLIVMGGFILGFFWSQNMISKTESSILGNQLR